MDQIVKSSTRACSYHPEKKNFMLSNNAIIISLKIPLLNWQYIWIQDVLFIRIQGQFMQSIIECTAGLCIKPFHWRVFFCYKHLITDYSTNRKKNALAWLLYIGCIEFVDNENDNNKNTKHCTAFLFGFGNNRLQQEKKPTNKKKIESTIHSVFDFVFWLAWRWKLWFPSRMNFTSTKTFYQRERPVIIFQMWTIFGFGLPIFFFCSLRCCFCCIFFLLSHSGLNLVQFFLVALRSKWCFSSVHNNSPVYGPRWWNIN